MVLNDKVALVTGASRGIGAAIAAALGAQGATVVGTATTEAGAAKISERFAAEGVKGRGMALDVTSADSVAAVL
ncbi:MAG: SDR family NAD(P)-dependent oxidoreductase, partial [Porticoccaceae bacterium]|nr:SDR family NAD(P)-dependent oxidoreductase [Porticoccaceae bacterium]